MAEHRLCERCDTMILNAIQQIDGDSRIDDVHWLSETHHVLPTSSTESEFSNCYTCLHMQNMLQDARQEAGEENSDRIRFGFYMYQQTRASDGLLYLCIRTYFQDDNDDAEGHRLAEREFQINGIDSSDQLQATAYLSSIQTSSGSKQSLNLAAAWLRECIDSHTYCRNEKPTWFPTRLLHISKTTARLIECNLEPPLGQYATLSHCWGGDLSLKLTSTNRLRFEEGLSFNQFKPSFRHAMLVVKSLGIEYIWIDCFCIIQGSDEPSKRDWAEQSVQMGDVYANGVINIGATAASSADDGCFVIRNKTCADWVSISDASNGKLYQVTEARYFDELDEEPLLCRAWVVQERHLCSRMLHFSNQQIFWQCATLPMASELAPRGLDVRGATQNIAETLIAPGEIANRGVELSSLKRKHAWDWILASYCDAGLSFPAKDKHRAIAGLANYLAVKLGDTYHQGFFSKNLPKSLCWSTFSARLGKLGSKRRAAERNIATWSWASMDGSLNFSNECDEEVQVLAVAIGLNKLPSLSANGNDNGRVVCIGRLIHVSLYERPTTYFRPTFQFQEAYVGTNGWERLFFFDDAQEMQVARSSLSGVFLFPISTNITIRSATVEPSTVFTEPVRERTSFLVLTRNSDGTFCRLGARRTLDDFSNRGVRGSWLESFQIAKPRLIVIV